MSRDAGTAPSNPEISAFYQMTKLAKRLTNGINHVGVTKPCATKNLTTSNQIEHTAKANLARRRRYERTKTDERERERANRNIQGKLHHSMQSATLKANLHEC